jgi:hypothetical protein
VRRGKVPSCLSVGIPPKGRTSVAFDLPGAARAVKGLLHSERGKSGIRASLVFDRAGSSPMQLETAGKQGRRFRAAVPTGSDRATFRFASDRGKPARICIEAVALTGGTP